MTRRHSIPPRMRVFIGCEGESEQGYARWLQSIADEAGIHVTISNPLLKQSGDFLGLIAKAIRKSEELEQAGTRFGSKWVLLDEDMKGQNSEKDRCAHALAVKHSINIIWQRPDFEGLLLRHFQGYESARPPRGNSEIELRRVWRDYNKGEPAVRIRQRLSVDNLRRVCRSEPELETLLIQIRLPLR